MTAFADEVTPPDNDFRTPLQYAYLMDAPKNYAAYAKGAQELSIPRGIICDFSGDGFGESEKYVFQKADNPEFENAFQRLNLTEPVYAVQNVLLGEHFYWRGGTSLDTIGESPVHEVTVTDLAPRMCAVDRVTNVRDVGGYASSLVPGGKTRQERYYRGAKLDWISDAGAMTLRNELGVKAEIDLRGNAENNGPYVDGVEYFSFEIPSGTESKRFEEFKEQYVGIYTTISNADVAPVYLHCSVGADRTGLSTFMLLAVCGVSYDDIVRDYLMTNFSNPGERPLTREFNTWWKKLNLLDGATVAEKAKTWMLSKGLSEETIERVREVMVDGYISDIERSETYEATVSGVAYKDTLNALVLKSSAPADEFVGVKVDGAALFDSSFDYDRKTGELTFSPDYIASLDAGEYEFSFVSEKGVADGTFTVEETTPAPKGDDTGKDSQVWLYVAIGVAAAAVIAVIVVLVVKKSAKKSK